MRSASPRGLVPLFEPRSIAVVGASATPEKVGYQLVEALREFPGDVFPINPKASEVAGRTAYPHLSAAPRVPDLVLLAVPAAMCPAALLEAAEIGVPAALIVSGGFAEMGAAGEHQQAQIQQICRNTGLRVLGPNTSGYTRPELGCHACFLPTRKRELVECRSPLTRGRGSRCPHVRSASRYFAERS